METALTGAPNLRGDSFLLSGNTRRSVASGKNRGGVQTLSPLALLETVSCLFSSDILLTPTSLSPLNLPSHF